MKHVRETPPPLPADIPPAVREIVMRTLAKDPANRWPSAAALAAVAKQAASTLGQVGASAPAPAVSPSSPSPSASGPGAPGTLPAPPPPPPMSPPMSPYQGGQLAPYPGAQSAPPTQPGQYLTSPVTS